MELPVISTKGVDTGRKAVLADSVFAIEPSNHSIYLDVKQYLANQRQGTHKAKQRNEIAGSSKKIKKQKGTGGARAGNIKSPTIVGGGRVFGPVPRDYRFKLNKKQKQVARRSALTYKAQEAAIKVLENFDFSAPKTKDYMKLLADLSLSGKKTLLVVDEHKPNVYLSSRNLPKTFVVRATDLNTYDVMNCDFLILCEGAVAKINEQLSKEEN
ncbi:MAG: 50S ribosomal protein L4 [Bernardetiaceae bacterium]|jgi:large subunit ribosomal protein L4|nr:50S ribosomal protein L4 [Bernardetiaceae bacterium]